MQTKKLRFATPDELFERTGLVPGSVPPFGEPVLPFQLLVDSLVFEQQNIAFNAGELTRSMLLAIPDYRRAITAREGSFSNPSGA